MLIDWFTVGAQALNFIILVWLLKRFLYKPILNAVDAREKRIAAELADADKKTAEAQRERDDFQRKNELFDQQRAALLSKATDEANTERLRLLDGARKAADELQKKRQETLRSDAKTLTDSIYRQTQLEVFAIARKALTALAGASLEERMTAIFIDRLHAMDAQTKDKLTKALGTTSEPSILRSAFDLPPDQRAAIQKAINDSFSMEVPLRFETAPDLIGGIELTSNGQKVAWSIAEYLTALERGIDELLKKKDKAEPNTIPAPKVEATPQPGIKDGEVPDAPMLKAKHG
jgi:F-type H+-transporting ATPase subunit b